MQTRLVLTHGSIDAASIVQRRMRFGEVILSACSTGYRPERAADVILAGDDAIGIPSAMIEAGARFVLASIPIASDEPTAAFVSAYHKYRKGAPPLRAFRAAQLELFKAGIYSPYEWVGLTAYGVC